MRKANLAEGISWASFLAFVVFLQSLTTIAVILDIPLVRQTSGLVYLTIIPGLVLLRIFRLDEADATTNILFSVGLSVSLLMFIGLLTNELYPLIGVSNPLSTVPLIATLNSVLLSLLLVIYFRHAHLNKGSEISRQSFNLSWFHILLLSLPPLSATGTLLVGNRQSNFLAIFVIVVISVLIFLSALSQKLVPPRFYTLLLFTIILALLLPNQLITHYVFGWDQHGEYYVLKLTEKSSYWDSTATPPFTRPYDLPRFNAMLSVTILPTIYSRILNLEGTWVFKIIYPCIFAFVAFGLYQLYRTQKEKMTAFLATFFFISEALREGIPSGPNKQIVAHFFLVLLLLVLFNKKMSPLKRKAFFIIFSAALVTSHYSTSYLFLFIIFITWVSSLFIRKSQGKISTSLVAIFFILTFSWYIYVSASAPFNAIVETGETVYRDFSRDFLNPQARSTQTLTGLGLGETVSFTHQIGRFFFHITEIFIIVGFAEVVLALIAKGKEPEFDIEYAIIVCASMAILLMNIILPNLAKSFQMDRFYHLALTILAPLCVSGGEAIFKHILKLKRKTEPKKTATILIVFVLVTLFLFRIELIYEVTGDNDSRNMALSMYRMDSIVLYRRIVSEQEVFGAQWLSEYANLTSSSVCADSISRSHVLCSYGLILGVQELSNTTVVDNRTFIYLRWVNVVVGIVEGGPSPQWSISEISSILEDQNKIYSNGGSDMYKGSHD